MSKEKPGVANASPSSPTILEVDHVSLSFEFGGQSRKVIDDISFTAGNVTKDDFLAITAQSGSGKSTLLRVIAGLYPPTRGEVRIHGTPVTGPSDSLFMVFQHFALIPWKNVLENIDLALASRTALSAEQCAKKALAAIHDAGLTGFERAYLES